MPKLWYDRYSAVKNDDNSEFQRMIVADRKPYFMRYIYPTLKAQYDTYLTNTNKKSLREFRITIDELLSLDEQELTDDQKQFIKYYKAKMPVGINKCVMNKICERFEEEFDGYIIKNKSETDFDYTIMKSGEEYTSTQYYSVLKLHNDYTKRVREYMQSARKKRVSEDENAVARQIMIQEFKRDCLAICSNSKQLCDIILDICYQKEGLKQFAWDISGEDIIDNLLIHNQYNICYPTLDENGTLEFGGEKFEFLSQNIKEE